MAGEEISIYTCSCSRGEGKYQIYGMLSLTADGVIVQLLGGELPHVGTVIMSQPRPSMEDIENTSVTTSVLNLLHHKDDIVAKPVAEKFTRELKQVTVVVAGIHVDDAKKQDIEILKDNVVKVADDLLLKAKANIIP